MAKKKNNSKKHKPKRKSVSASKKERYEEEWDDEGEYVGLAPDTKYWIGVISVMAFAVISFLSLFDLAGPVGRFLSLTLTYLFGWGDFLIPFLFIWFGWVMIKRRQHLLHSIHYWGVALFVFSSYALLHWTQNSMGLVDAVASGRGGGYVGLVLSWSLLSVLGPVAGVIFNIAIFVISILLLFDASANTIFGSHNIFVRAYLGIRNRITGIRDDYYDDEYEYDEDNQGDFEHLDDEEGDGEDIEQEEEYSDEEGAEEADDAEDDYDEKTETESSVDSVKKPNPKKEQGELLSVPRRKMPRVDIPLSMFKGKPGKPNSGDIKANQEIIERTLETFGIPVEMGEVNIGPTVTQYTFRPAEGIKVNKILTLQNDLALALAAHSIRIEAPIPGKALVGIEIPNQTKALVTLKELLISPEFKKKHPSTLMLPLGKDVAGRTYVADLATMPHLLIAGSTGSGKSIAINVILASLMYQNQPTDLKFILIDPKRVELTSYENIPYLITPVITEYKKTVGALRWAVNEMDRRYTLLSHSGHRQLSTYNRDVSSNDRLPNIVIVIDELADLMAAAAADIEASVVRIAQMARAVGIHLILATQRPSVDVITGLIKANFPSRIAFSVASLMDSRTILDASGAEKLLGRGDMLFNNPQLSKPRRLQGAFISDDEITSIGQYLRGKAKPDFLSEVVANTSMQSDDSTKNDAGGDDSLLEDAKEVILSAGKASASLLQRRLRVGYSRAARILDILEEQGFVGPSEGSKPREVYGERENVTDSAELEDDVGALDEDGNSDYSDDIEGENEGIDEEFDDVGEDSELDEVESEDNHDEKDTDALEDDEEGEVDDDESGADALDDEDYRREDVDEDGDEEGEWDEETETYK